MQQKAKQQSFWQVCCKCITRTVLCCQCITKRGNWSYPFQVITHGSQGNFLLLERNKLVNEEPSFCPRKHTLQLFLLRCQRKLFRTGRKKKNNTDTSTYLLWIAQCIFIILLDLIWMFRKFSFPRLQICSPFIVLNRSTELFVHCPVYY